MGGYVNMFISEEGKAMTELVLIGKNAKDAKVITRNMPTTQKNKILEACADELIKKTDYILSENEKDVLRSRESGMKESLIDRLTLTKDRISGMANGLLKVSKLNDPVGEILYMKTMENGLRIGKRRTPLGVIGIIYESRPNVTADAFGLCLKSGNVTVLRGGKDAICSNMAIVEVFHSVLERLNINKNIVQLLTDTSRETATHMMKLSEYIDVLIPRGGAGLIKSVVLNSTIPVIETGTGNCHIFVDETADMEKALRIIINAKTQRTGVCNACESLLIHKNIADEFIPVIGKSLDEKGVEIYGDEKVTSLLSFAKKAMEDDYAKEYLDLKISVKTVSDIDEAIEHIGNYSTGHSESIITESYENALKFTDEVDSAAVYVNASTRFTDGEEFGFGAEIGISTQKLHARGPMGLNELTTTKYVVFGNGQIR